MMDSASPIARLARRLRALLFKRTTEQDMDEEMRFHLDMETEALARTGLDVTAARRRALVSFGGVERFKEAGRDARGTRWVEDFIHDARFGVRALTRSPAASAIVIVTLTLAVAASTTVFSLLNGLFLRPFPFPNADRLVYVNETAPRWDLTYTNISYPDFHVWREHNTAFEALALYSTRSVTITGEDRAERAQALQVTHDFARALGVRPLLGRTFTPDEDRPGGPPVVAIGRQLWEERFGASPRVLGGTLRINGTPHTIIGVLPDEAEFPGGVTMWLPVAGDPAEECCAYSYDGIGLLKPGVTSEQALDDLRRVHAAIWEARDTARVVSPIVTSLREPYVAGHRDLGTALGLGVALVLLIACANVAGVLLARSVVRQREIAVRRSLGASAGRISRQLLAESLVIAAAGGVLGTLLGQAALRVLLRSVPDELPGWARFAPDARTVVFAVALIVGTALLFGCVPALRARREAEGGALAAHGARASHSVPQRRTLNGLVVAEVAVAVMLLVGGTLLLRAYEHVRGIDPRFRVDSVLTFRVTLPPGAGEDRNGPAQLALVTELEARLSELPGVRAAGVISCAPLGCHQGSTFEGDGQPRLAPGESDPIVLTRWATAGHFRALGIRLLHGRFFTPDDERPDRPPVVIVNEPLAKRLWPGVANPVGRRLRYRGDTSATAWLQVVGVVQEARHYGLASREFDGMYFSAARLASGWWDPGPTVSIHTAVEPTSLAAAVRKAVREVSPALPVYQLQTMRDALDRSLAVRRTFAWMLAIFSGVALVLAVGGIYAVLMYVVGRRRREIGIRIALGAQRGNVVRAVVGHGLRLITVGLLLGLPLTLAGSRVLSSLLHGISSRDPLTYGSVAVLLAITGIAATLAPALRAASVDPRSVLSE
ncbi:MAG TPA: ABC transporter permease [Gemmatimonadaceae bacterium]|nr:ABC transporter permease [Gemmatimonadaceae bacterium]